MSNGINECRTAPSTCMFYMKKQRIWIYYNLGNNAKRLFRGHEAQKILLFNETQ